MGHVTLTGKGRRGIRDGHPWIYADAIAAGEGEPGELLPVFDPNDQPLGWGLFSAGSKIAVRLVTRQSEQPNRAFWAERVQSAIALRAAHGLLAPEGASRLLHGDADGIPGLVIDRYADVLVVQSGTQAADRMRDFVLELVEEALPFAVRAVYDRSNATVRRLESLEPRVEWVRGRLDEPIEVVEPERDGSPRLVYEVSVEEGHKTGAYLDQAENRRQAARHAAGARVLDAFSYDGLFGIRAALAGARSVLCLDQSQEAGARLLRNAERNGVADRVAFERTNAMHDLRDREARGERYELVIVDPPAFARNRREAEGAARGYRELNRRAAALVERDGLLVSSSCSFNVRREAFLGYVGEGAFLAGRAPRLVAATGAAPDHPVLLTLPETDYLKCAFVRL